MLSTALPRRMSPGLKADFVAHLARHQIVVAGEDFDHDAMLLQGGNGGAGGVFGRIQEGDVAFEDQIAFVGLGISGALVQFLARDRQHAEAVRAQIVVLLDEVPDQNRLHRETLALAFKLGAAAEDGFRRALGQDLALALGRFHDDRHHPARKIEREFIGLAVLLDAERGARHRDAPDTARSRTFFSPV